MDSAKRTDFHDMTTFELAFNLATGKYGEAEKFEALKVIQERDQRDRDHYLNPSPNNQSGNVSEKAAIKPPLKGSKSEKIYKLAMEGKTPQECFEILNKKGTTVYYPEIYRVFKRYSLA
jgi:hypothetical protein